HKSLSQLPDSDLDCAEACIQWLKELQSDENMLVVDYTNKILGSYRKHLNEVRSSPNTVAQEVLNHLHSTGRIRYVEIIFDKDGYAELAAELNLDTLDRDDRKFVAVVLACEENDRPPIVNATDTDWDQCSEELQAAGIEVQ